MGNWLAIFIRFQKVKTAFPSIIFAQVLQLTDWLKLNLTRIQANLSGPPGFLGKLEIQIKQILCRQTEFQLVYYISLKEENGIRLE